MATQSVGTVNQQVWDETIVKLLNISNATVKQNLELEARVAELEVELAVWKQAHSVALEASEREATAHNVQIASLNKQISNTDGFRANGNHLILCVVDGQQTFFAQSLLIQGLSGGRAAAQYLAQVVAEHLATEGGHIFGRLSFWITIYINKVELINTLCGQNVCSREQLEGFLAGFSQSSSRFTVVDVGLGEDGPDHKIGEYIQTFARFPQTLRVFLSGCCDPSYSGIFNSLDSEKLLGKLVSLRSASDDWPDQPYPFPVLNAERLLVRQIQTPRPTSQRPTPLSVAPLEKVSSSSGLISPQSPVRDGARLIDPKYPLHKQAPPPCNEHYLMTCSKGAGACKYSHDYILSPEQLALLATNAKKAPCNWLKNGLRCPYGDKCCWGHSCPNGPKCFHLSKGKCWFKGEAMHNAPASSYFSA